MEYGQSYSLPTSVARSRLSEIITCVQDPRATVVLTRHGRPVAAVVSMAELKRIWNAQDIADMTRRTGKRHRPSGFYFGPSGKARTVQEAAEEVQKIQLDRRSEREMLAMAGLEVVEGGEVTATVEAGLVQREPRRRWWQLWRRRA